MLEHSLAFARARVVGSGCRIFGHKLRDEIALGCVSGTAGGNVPCDIFGSIFEQARRRRKRPAGENVLAAFRAGSFSGRPRRGK